MRFVGSIATIIFAIANLAAAQSVPSATPTASQCDAQNILDACLKSTKITLNLCEQQDYSCLCTQWNNVLTCYNNCPADQGRYGVESSKQANCNAASLLSSASKTASITSSSTASSSSAPTTTTTGGASITSTASPSGSAKPNAAAGMRGDGFVGVEVGGLMALLAIGLGTLL